MTPKQTALRALMCLQSDDANRVRAMVAGMSLEQRLQPYGDSGYSYQHVLESYEQKDREIQEAIDWVRSMPDSNS